jgi:phosphatidylglycerophosphate synthase
MGEPVTTVRFGWLPNAITFTRLLLSVPIFVAAINEVWALAFWLFVFALITDFLDGLAARKLGAFSKIGEDLDAYSDASLVVSGMLALSITGHLPWWITISVLAIGVGVGLERFFVHRPAGLMIFFKVISVGGLFVEWTAIAWMFATQAYGWSWWYVLLTLVTLAICASLKRHRIYAWLHPKVLPKPPAKR